MENLSVYDYKYKTWSEKYKGNVVSFLSIKHDPSWKELFSKEKKESHWIKIETYLSKCLSMTDGKIRIYPYPDLVFNAFNCTSLKDIKVVILGQDPYHDIYECESENNSEEEDDSVNHVVPQAMGLSFSVPIGVPIPSSLKNIFANLKKYKHIKEIPKNGNLMHWACQGCMMLNTSLTVQHGHANSHAKVWQPFTDNVIEYISNSCEHVVFVLWGSNALSKLDMIDTDKHHVIISSHPSGLSCNKKLKNYPAFVDVDHFGAINKYLTKHKKNKIDWTI